MPHFKFLLDRDVVHLASCFPRKRTITTAALGLPDTASDETIIELASANGYVIVSANRRDFAQKVPAYIAKSSKTRMGCCRVSGLVLLVPNDEITQKRVLHRLENRLSFNGKKITYTDVHKQELQVLVSAAGTATVTRLPRCPHCTHYDDKD